MNTDKVDSRQGRTFRQVEKLAKKLGVQIGHDEESNCISLRPSAGEKFPDGTDLWLCMDWVDALEMLQMEVVTMLEISE